jgi:hypothetical protein
MTMKTTISIITLIFTAGPLKGITVAAFRSDAPGCFAVQVPSGNYVVVQDVDAPILFPESQTRTVTVGPDGWTQVELTFDTGIR